MKPAVRMTLETSVQTVKDNAMYTSKAFVGGMTARKALEYSMSDLAKQTESLSKMPWRRAHRLRKHAHR